MSDEMVRGRHGGNGCLRHRVIETSTPWPISNITPLCLAARAAGSSLPSWTILVNLPPMLGAPE